MGDDWMQLWVNAAQMKAADQYTIQKLGVPSLELMEHAAQACVQVLEDEKVDLSHVCVVCGSGNNGGDGFAIARILQNNRYSVETFCVGNPEHYTEETQEQMHRLQECGGKITYGMPQVTESKNPELEKTVRIFPHRMKGEGHFLALLQKGEKQEEGKRLPESGKNKKLPEELEEFLGHIDRKFDSSRMDLRGEKVYYMPEGLSTLRGIRFLRTGLLMGELKKNRFEPSQALAMNLKKEEYDQVIDLPLEDERVMKYLKGETLDVEDLVKPKDKGWYLICVDGYPLGFGKLVNQMLKNKYLPGWRWNS